MGRAEEIASALNAIEAERTHRQKRMQVARAAIQAQADELWNALVRYVCGEVEKIADSVQAAKDSGLTAKLFGNVLIVSTRQLPLLNLAYSSDVGT